MARTKRQKITGNTLVDQHEDIAENQIHIEEPNSTGTIARNGKYAPLDVTDWREMTNDKKQDMLVLVKEKFRLSPGADFWTLKSIGKKWRNWKSALKAKYYNPNESIESQINNRDQRILKDQWRNLLAYWSLKETKMKKLGHLPSRVDMFEHCYTDSNGNPGNDDVAATLQALKEKVSQLPPGSNDDVGRNDAFAQVFGEDNNGRVCMYGLGVTPSDKWGNVPSRSTCQRIVMEQKAAISKMEDKFAEQDQQLKDQAKELAELKAMVCQQQNSGSKTGGSINSTSSNHVSKSPMGARSLQEGDWVDIFSLFDPTKCLAIGRLQGIDPSKVVGGQPLGPCWCEILVQIVMERNEQLIRPYGLLQTIEDALGAPIAWPLKLVKIHED
ncbi:uncharacterized protein LOC113755501 [Coffea eugenioides]|uniref:uncharacterized protein LOC113755501 n=1 Tax=Coffea eugenioides TaxID=49369 RepID=UPI000F610E4D|nr:uncharacterized protein LOC113755501 [Coffea eugenioides]